MTSKHILFVDDEPSVLHGLRRMLRPMRHEWNTAFASSGKEALNMLSERPFDVIVSDMRMPDMDGAALLTEVTRQYPQVVRIVLSGHSAKDTILRSVGLAHQYLSKPCDAETLKCTVSRVVALRSLLGNDSLKNLISKMKSLPSLPGLYVAVIEELQRPEASINKVGEIISQDLGMTAKVLQLVNSAFFGLARHVSSAAQAASLLGLNALQALVLTVNVFTEFHSAKAAGFCIETLWHHSMVTGATAKKIALAENDPEQAVADTLMAGLLHDAGKLMLAQEVPALYQDAMALAQRQSIPDWQAERRILGATHAEVGGYLLGLWGLPDPIVEAVAFHHNPSRPSANTFTPLTAAHVANVLRHQQNPDDRQQTSQLDLDYLSRIGLTDRLPVWRDISHQVADNGAEK